LKKSVLLKTIFWPVCFVAILWAIEGLSELFKVRFIELGVIPRTLEGLPGIIFSPFIHSGIDHLLSNTLPLLVVGSGIFYFYKEIAIRVISLVWLFTGFWVWLAARDSSHIGASGLIYGFVCFLFFSGLLRKDTRLLAVSLLVTFLYGSMVWGILPVDQSISWESHLFGSVAGIFSAIYFRKEGPQRVKPQWEIDEELEASAAEESADWIVDTEIGSDGDDYRINYHYVDKSNEENESQKGENQT
jgi:membrane associated rhomboid family serine protease